jgi:hypothetical protein
VSPAGAVTAVRLEGQREPLLFHRE